MKGKHLVVSYPKSGRTWLRYAAEISHVELTFTHADVFTQAEFIGKPWRGVPELISIKPCAFLHRNPLDTAVSFYFQVLHKDVVPGRKTWRRAERRGIDMPPIDLAKCVLHPMYGIEAVCQYNRAMLDALHEDASVFTYEALRKHPEKELRRFFKYQGITTLNIERLADLTSFRSMRNVQMSSEGAKYRLTQHMKRDPESAKVRKGKVRGYVDYLDPETIEACRAVAAKYNFSI